MKTLYCVTFEVYKNREWHAREEYMHADDQAHARAIWAVGVPKNFKVGINVRIVGIAPAIGVHTNKAGQNYA